MGFDVHIADDGSGAETKAKIESLAPLFPHGIEHHWHADEGYRKAKINNDVFRKLSDYSVVILVDGDTIAHHRFIEDHLSRHKNRPRLLFMGRRIDLSPNLSSSLSEENITAFNRGLPLSLLASVLARETKNLSRAFRITSPILQKLLRRNRVKDLLGSNFSISRELLFEVNGYDEAYQAYWGEDGDLFVRVRNAGAEIEGLKSFAIQYHLYHPRLEPKKEHEALYQERLRDNSYRRCKMGISK
jgi:GT2 family glycosyltransferase